MRVNHKMARSHLDSRIKKIGQKELFSRPIKGWIRAIREALGMTSTQMANKMGVSSPRILAMEKDEASGNIKLKTLELAAEALGCQLVYVFLPAQGLEETVYAQAEKKADVILKQAEHTMKLENLASSKEDDTREREELIKQLLNGSQARLWDEL